MPGKRVPRHILELAGFVEPADPTHRHLIDMTPEEAERFLRTGDPRPNLFGRAILDFSQLRSKPVEWLWPGRVPYGKLTILEGDPGLGKSLIMLDLAARLTTGAPVPDDPSNEKPETRNDPASVVILSAEDSLADTVRPRLEAAGADLSRVAAIPVQPDNRARLRPRLPADLTLVARFVLHTRARLLVLDPFIAFLPTGASSYTDSHLRAQLYPLALTAERFKIAIVLVRHLTKSSSRNPLYRGGGSIGMIGVVRSGLLAAPDPDDPTGARRLLLPTKANLAAEPPALAYRVVTATNGAPAIRWEGHSPHTATTALLGAPADHARGDALAEATAILTTILADGPLPADQVRREATRAGLGPSLLWRAKQTLGIRSQKLGGRDHSDRNWLWVLPGCTTSIDQDPDDPTTEILES